MSRVDGVFSKSLFASFQSHQLNKAFTSEAAPWKWMPLIVPIAIAFILRLYQISAESVWIDELNSYEDAILMESGNLGIRPLYYLLLRVWMLGGKSDAWLRGFSVLLDLGAIAVAYLLCQYAISRRAACLTALMMALSPLLINHAQEIRMYPLITLLTVSGTLMLAYALERPTKGLIALWAVLRLAAMFTSPLMIIMFLPDCVLYGLKYWRRWPQLRLFFYGLLFVGVGWAPLVLREVFSATENYVAEHSEYESFSVPITQIFAKLTTFTVYWPLVGLENIPNPVPQLFYKAFTLLLVGLLIFAIIKIRPSLDNKVLWIGAWALLPTLAQFFGSELFLSGTLFRARYFLYTVPYLMMLLAYGFDQIRAWKPLIAGLVAALYLVAVGGGLAQYYTQIYRNDWQGAAEVIEAQEQSGDAIINFTMMADYNFPRYYKGDLTVSSIHLPRTLSRCVIAEPSATETSEAITACLQDRGDLVQESVVDLPEADRLWLVCYVGCRESEDYDRITEAVLGENFQETSFQRFDALTKHDFEAVELHLLESEAG
ncbi:hypothetical protein PN498_08850 [Oscillatoria sp. CS-180]|uniref:glycosyltransferase family 39 protein n=1 Tax=Oscillatoria sp. CS-180 TaxID=3021720 RepID=UPI00232B41E5|nr:hypothetical protein [Oscillatoria sp. CS-180]MDB9526093.1 hypothetical protein [Oscillatoria sp. CS-180]